MPASTIAWGLGRLRSLAAAAGRKPISFHCADGADALRLQGILSHGLDCFRAESCSPFGGENGRPLVHLVHRVARSRHTVGFKRVWMRAVSEEHPAPVLIATKEFGLCPRKSWCRR